MNDYFMKCALEEAKKAYEIDEIPVGCVIVKDNKIISRGHNIKEMTNNCLKHAEIIAVDKACSRLNSWRLDDCSIYITLEPCMMCMGAIFESRIKNVYYGTSNNSEQMYDKNLILSKINLINLNSVDCSIILSDFFKNKRKK